MQSNYKRLGDYIRQVDVRNRDLAVDNLLGLSISKRFIPSIANTIGTDMANYKIVQPRQFGYVPVTSRNGDKITVALYEGDNPCIISQAYIVFEVTDMDKLLPEYLMMWFRRPEFDRYARFKSHGSAREVFEWDEMCDVMLPVPSIEEQRKIVAEYQAVERRIENNRRLIATLESAAQTIYRKMFVYNIDPENLPQGWRMGTLKDTCIIIMGQSPEGESLNLEGRGVIFYQGRTDFGLRYPSIRTYSDNPKKFAKKGDVLLSVRAPVGDINLSNNDCAIGRGIAAIRSKLSASSYAFYLMWSLYEEMSKSNDDGTVFGSINKDALEQLSIVLPPENEIIKFEKAINPLDRLIIDLCGELSAFNVIQSLLLSKLSKL
ncbi:restriction endonuclease subunit S [uncultured Duncaniella sp.]|uniref:restriction endonuclease subunit S n=1 Tax=uncultured Duncaniella sp. TaxID=2768039 RepID=UPI0025B67F8F|nr:restriction endonuclease subunit S [uncultured Duncaniella sp.]